MKQIKTLILLTTALFVLIIINGCKKESATSVDLSGLSGVWKNAYNTIQTGTCGVTGSPTGNLIQNWTVDKNGNVTIVETALGSTGSQVWTGKIANDYTITATTTGSATCSGSLRTFTVTMTGKIVSQKTLNASFDLDVCPPNCLFRREYTSIKE